MQLKTILLNCKLKYNTEHLNNIVTSKKKIANNADEIILSKEIDNIVIASPADTHKKYINRLSDFFFVLSRMETMGKGSKEIVWEYK